MKYSAMLIFFKRKTTCRIPLQMSFSRGNYFNLFEVTIFYLPSLSLDNMLMLLLQDFSFRPYSCCVFNYPSCPYHLYRPLWFLYCPLSNIILLCLHCYDCNSRNLSHVVNGCFSWDHLHSFPQLMLVFSALFSLRLIVFYWSFNKYCSVTSSFGY